MVRKLCSVVLLASMAVPGLVAADPIAAQIARMSADDKIAQLLFIGIASQIEDDEVRLLRDQWHAGGVVLYAYNIESPGQLRRLTAAIGATTATKPFIAIDQEGGIVRRVQLGVPVIPSAMALGATRSPDLARRAGFAVACGLRDLGFTMNFAPVLDVLSNAHNNGIETRSFGADPALVATLGTAFIAGQHDGGILSVGKHFPGLGGVAEDTHDALPRLDEPLAVLRRRELVPFAAAFRTGLDGVMTGHVALPQITGQPDLPASLSRRILTDLIRRELRFDGVVISDALQMKALGKRTVGELALDSLLAGADMVLALGTTGERAGVLTFLREAYGDGRLPKRRVESALRRILRAKRARPTTCSSGSSSEAIVREIANASVTVVGAHDLLPASSSHDVVYVGPDGPLRKHFAAIAITLPPTIDDPQRHGFVASAAAAAVRATMIIAVARNNDQFLTIEALHAASPKTPIIFVNLSAPHRFITGKRAVTLLTYSDSNASQEAAAQVIAGTLKATGTAPIQLDYAALH